MVAHAEIRILQVTPHTLRRILSTNYFFKRLEFVASNKKANRHNDPNVPELTFFISTIDDVAGKTNNVFNNVLTLFQIEQTNQTVMTQKLQQLQNKHRRKGGASLYCKNIV